jgi:hypothetical protein
MSGATSALFSARAVGYTSNEAITVSAKLVS